MTRESRRAAYGRGRRAERLAAWWLRLKGYRLVASGLRTSLGKIDLVVRRGRVLAFVEVKTRGDLAGAAEATGAAQRRRIERAALLFLQRRRELAGLQPRFDALLLSPRRLPRHIPDAWRPQA